MSVDRLRKEYHVEVRWIAFPLHPETPEEGLTLEELFAGRPVDIPQMLGRLKEVAQELGLPLGSRERTYNSRLAQELGKWAEGKGVGDAFHDAVFRAYFADGKNIAHIPVLAELAASVGLPGDEARTVLEARAFRETVDQDWKRSRIIGVTAVPTFVMGRRGVVGAQPYEVLEELVRGQGAGRRDAS